MAIKKTIFNLHSSIVITFSIAAYPAGLCITFNASDYMYLNLQKSYYFYILLLFSCFTSKVNSYGYGGAVSSPKLATLFPQQA